MSLLALASLLIGTQLPGGIPPATGNFSGYPSGIMLQLDIDGAHRLFTLDSGADSSYLPPASKSRKDLPSAVDWKLSLLGSIVATVHAHRDGGQYTLRDTSPRPFGSLGTDFLRQVILMIDPRSEKFAIWPAGRCSFAEAMDWARKNPNWAGSAEFEGEWHDEVLGLSRGCATVPISVDSRRLAVILDTGSSISSLSLERLNQVRHWSLFQEGFESFTEATYCPAYLVPGIRATFLQEPISVVLCPLEILDGLDGIYGLDFLNQGQWILDEGRQMFAFKQYKPDGYLHLRTPSFQLFWKEGEAWVQRCDESGIMRGKPCKLASIDGKPLSQVLNPPTGDPILPGDLATFGQQLHELFARPFRLGLKDGRVDRTISVDPSKWFQ